MTNAFWFVAPLLVLALASAGAGALCLRPATAIRTSLPAWLTTVLEYFVGQGVLTTYFLGLALAGQFHTPWIALPLGMLAAVGAVVLAARRRDWSATAQRAHAAWRSASLAWKVLSGATAALFAYGFTSVAGDLWVDSPAFYMAMSRLIAGTGRLTALPGYDYFSAIGLFGELHMAALFSLGMTGTSPRVLSWVAFVPTVAVIYGLARLCGLGRRGTLLTIAATVSTSSIASLWGAGKADLFAIGPALAAVVIVLALWDRQRLGAAPFVSGLLFGYAALSKVSYLVAFLPGLAVLLLWQRILVTRPPRQGSLVMASLPVALLFGCGVLIAFGQNFVKNALILDTPFARFAMDPFFSDATTVRLLVTYPFAVTYGRYWGQAGTLSPIVLAFLPLIPFYLRWPAAAGQSRLLAVSVAAVVSLVAWLVMFPSIITMRYIQATLLLFALPAAAAAENATRRSRLLAVVIPVGVLMTLASTPPHTAIVFPTFSSPRATLAAVMGSQEGCAGSHPFEADCLAHTSINAAARPGDRVLGLSYLRYWLEPTLMQNMSSVDEVNQFLACSSGPCSAAEFWDRFLRNEPGFSFILLDATTHPLTDGVLTQPPPGVVVRRLFVSGNISVHEVRHDADEPASVRQGDP